MRALFPMVLLSAGAACGKSTVPSEGGATTQAPSMPSASGPPICVPWIVTELAVPKDWKTYPVVAGSGAERTIESRSFDHYVDELIDVPIGPLVLRYWQGRTRPTTDSLVLRLGDCDGKVLPIRSLSYWNGGSLVLRAKDSVFVLSSGDLLIAVIRRLPS